MDLDKKQLKEQKKASKKAERNQKLADFEAQEAAGLEMAGREIASEFIMGTVRIFENGYVVVGLQLGVTKYEKLLGFEVFSENVTKKTGLGRTAGAALTLGINLLSPNSRGNIIVTIVTDKKTHSGKVLPQVQMITAVNKLQAAANVVLNSASKPSLDQSSGTESLSSSLEKLVSLRDSGALTQEEFEKAKSKLLE
jgi:hypothetical protein